MTDEDQLRSYIIERLMCDFHIDLEDVCAKFETPVEYFRGAIAQLDPLISDELVSVDGWCIEVLPRGKMLVRMACAAFDQYHDPNSSKPAHAKAI